MFERFTERSRQVVVIAMDIVRQHGHSAIGVDHLLVALALEDEGLAARVLKHLNFDVELALSRVVDLNPSVEGGADVQSQFTPRAKDALEGALRETLSLGHNYIGTESVLLGVLRASVGGEGPAAALLEAQHITPDAIRSKVIQAITEGASVLDDKDAPPVKPAPNPDEPLSEENQPTTLEMPVELTQHFPIVRPLVARPRHTFSTPDAYQLRPNPTFTVSDLVEIGEVAKASMDVIGLPQEFIQGYAALIDAVSHLLGLAERSDEAARA